MGSGVDASSLFAANGRGKTSVAASSSPGGVGTRSSVHRRDSGRENLDVERSGEQGMDREMVSEFE